MKKFLLSACFLAAAISPAAARDWYVLDAGAARCEPIMTIGTKIHVAINSPADYIRVTRAWGFAPSPKIYRYTPTETGVVVDTNINGSPLSMMFFTSMEYCLKALRFTIEDGIVAMPGELN